MDNVVFYNNSHKDTSVLDLHGPAIRRSASVSSPCQRRWRCRLVAVASLVLFAVGQYLINSTAVLSTIATASNITVWNGNGHGGIGSTSVNITTIGDNEILSTHPNHVMQGNGSNGSNQNQKDSSEDESFPKTIDSFDRTSEGVIVSGGHDNTNTAAKTTIPSTPTSSSSSQSHMRNQPSTVESSPQQTQLNNANVSIVVKLSGELGNNLHHIAHGIGLQEWLRQEYAVESNIILRHPDSSGKWKKTYSDIKTCFPVLATWDFAAGNSKEFDRLEMIQKGWLKGRDDQVIELVNSANLNDVSVGLYRLSRNILNDPTKPQNATTTSSIHVPFIVSFTIMDAFPVIDRYIDTIRRVFVYDHSNPQCCARVPMEDETVFHFRNYLSELRDPYNMGFAELSPNKTAYELFGPSSSSSSSSTTTTVSLSRLSPGDKVSVLSRIPNKYARAYAERLNEVLGTNATLLQHDHTGLQDFCYMMHTHHELVGNGRSTYLFWAAVLGPNIQCARLYLVDNFGLRAKFPNFWTKLSYRWTNPYLQKRVHWELYQSEEVDAKDGPMNVKPRVLN